MKLSRFKTASVTALMAATLMTACGSGSGSSPDADPTVTSEGSSDVGVSLRMLGFGDTVSFEVVAENNGTSMEYTSNEATISGTGSVPASGSASISAVPFGNYDFTINVYDSSSVLIVTQSYDNGGTGYDILTNSYDVEFTVNLGNGDDLSGDVSSYTSTISITGNLDFPPTPDLDVNDISLVGNFGATDGSNDVTATFGDDAVAFYDYEDAGSTTPIDLCESSGAISLAYTVTDSSGTSCSIASSSIGILYYNSSSSDYTSATCTGADCCRFEVELEEGDLASCGSTTFAASDEFKITVTGSDSQGNSATATVNVDINP